MVVYCGQSFFRVVARKHNGAIDKLRIKCQMRFGACVVQKNAKSAGIKFFRSTDKLRSCRQNWSCWIDGGIHRPIRRPGNLDHQFLCLRNRDKDEPGSARRMMFFNFRTGGMSHRDVQ